MHGRLSITALRSLAEVRMRRTNWYQHHFGEHYLRAYSKRLLLERTTREVQGISALLSLAPGSSILDLCCGHGRHAIPLAE